MCKGTVPRGRLKRRLFRGSVGPLSGYKMGHKKKHEGEQESPIGVKTVVPKGNSHRLTVNTLSLKVRGKKRPWPGRTTSSQMPGGSETQVLRLNVIGGEKAGTRNSKAKADEDEGFKTADSRK